ncbi:Helicase SRCAP, partial [Tetrabaena socialis]
MPVRALRDASHAGMERAWKLKQAKRFSSHAMKSNLSLENRHAHKQQQEEVALRKVAKGVALQFRPNNSPEISNFWAKARRVVATKVALQVEARKKVVMDKHLDLIVGQTEKFSKMLAANLSAPPDSDDDIPPPRASSSESEKEEPTPPPAAPAQQQRDGCAIPGPAIVPAPAPTPSDVAMTDVATRRVTFQEPLAASPPPLALPTSAERAGPSAGPAGARVKIEDDGGAGGATPPRMRAKRRRSASPARADTAGLSSAPAVTLKEESGEGDLDLQALASSDEEHDEEAGPGRADAEEEVDADGAEGHIARRQLRSRRSEPAGEGILDGAQPCKSSAHGGGEEEDNEYDRAADDSADDETTIDAELAMAEGEEGEDASEESAGDELGGLDAEVEVPLEQLLARYYSGPKYHTFVVKEAAAGAAAAAGVAGAAGSGKQVGQAGGVLGSGPPDGAETGEGGAASEGGAADEGGVADGEEGGQEEKEYVYKEEEDVVGIWGPHLIVVPTSVMLNWEMEIKKWCPAFRLLTYYGSAKERKAKRQGWSKPNAFHICITSYTLVLSDAKMFRRKKWKYLILDEAHMIKNWKSQRWQTLLRFNSKRRLLITGTPLQNDLMELWSLMHFLMPGLFASHDQFRDWFCNPLTGMVEGSEAYNKQLVERLHGVLRPFLLRRLK